MLRKKDRIDIKENSLSRAVLEELLKDRTTGENILWATDDYAALGEDYAADRHMTAEQITGENGMVIKPRVEKDRSSQTQRSKDKAEVFTPSWVCNMQNNLIDDAWFGSHTNRFNKETGTTWDPTYMRKDPNDWRDRIKFPNTPGKTWRDYVAAQRLEVSCGEAPYLTSRYDTVTGVFIPVGRRIGLLDRKLRVIRENTSSPGEWLAWAKTALQSTYGFEWQGDNVLLARENLLLTVSEHYFEAFGTVPDSGHTLEFAQIISWNLWQMDGIKCVIPNSCHDQLKKQITMFEQIEPSAKETEPCPGCKSGNRMEHNGIYAKIMDWTENKEIRFVDLLNGGKPNGTL